MFGNASKTNGVRLIALVAVLAMVFAGVAVIMNDSDVSAAKPEGMDVSSNSITLTEDITLSTPIVIDTIEGLTDDTVIVDGTNGSGKYTITDDVANGVAIYTNGKNVTFKNIIFKTSVNITDTILNSNGGTIVFENCEFQCDGTKMAYQAFAQSGSSFTFNNCTFTGNATVHYNMAGGADSGSITFNDCNGVSLAIENNGDYAGPVTIGAESTDKVTLTGTNTISALILGWDFGNGYANTTVGIEIQVNSDLTVDEILVGADNKNNSVPAGIVNEDTGVTVTADRSEVDVLDSQGDKVTDTIGEYTNYYSSWTEVQTKLNDGHEVTINTAMPDLGMELKVSNKEILNIIGVTINAVGGGKIVVEDGGTLILDGADIYVPVDADTENGATVVLRNTKSYTISDGTITSSIRVGYGNTVNADSINVQSGLSIEVYGNFNVSGSLRITDGVLNVYQGGTATVSGNLNIASNANIDGVLNVESNVNIQGSGSSAIFTVGTTGEVNVASGATFTVARGNSVVTNTLAVETKGKFNVEGTLAMNGTLSGAVNTYGTVQINGVIDTAATVNLFDQTSISVSSISGGALTITDATAATDYAGDLATTSNVSEGNKVVLTPSSGTISGITVSVAVTQFVYEGAGNYISDMTVGGTIVSSADGGTIEVSGATVEVIYNADSDKRAGYIHVNDTTLSAGASMEISRGTIVVDGTLDASAAATTGTNSKSKADLTITGGIVNVNGAIKVSEDELSITGGAKVNAAYYYNLVDTRMIYTYTSADSAIAAIADAEMDTITFIGDTKVTVDATIPANTYANIESGATVTVEAVLTIADNAYVTNNGAIKVDNTLIITNYLATINSVAGIDADVMTQSGDDRTYMSLRAAMDSGATEIVLNQTVTVDEDLTIPEGVTVTSDQWGFIVNDDVTLTVDGAIELTGRNVGIVLTTADPDSTPNDKAELIVNGHVSYAVPSATDPLSTIEGAHFQKRVDGLNTQFISNVGYAAENCSEGTITIYGNVTAGDVTLTAAENKTLTIIVANISSTEKSTLTVGTLTLVGATLDLCTTSGAPSYGYGTVTGTIIVSADGAVVGAIDADKATGFKLSPYAEITAEGTNNYAYLTGNVEGDVIVSEGTVTVGAANEDVSLNVNDDSTLTVASGATLVLADEMIVATAADADENDDALLTVDGIITVGEEVTLTINGDAVINGTMNVLSTEDGNGTVIIGKSTSSSAYTGTLDINGTLNVASYSSSQYGKVLVSGVLTIGAKPTTLGVGGTLTGNIGITDGSYVKVYAGADLGESAFYGVSSNNYNTSSEAEYTQYLINGSEYMTVYAVGSVEIYSIIDAEVFEISGIQNGVNFAGGESNDSGLYLKSSWFTSESMAANTVLDDECIGDVQTVYGKAAAANVYGTVSEGDGLTLYIDNVPISASSPEYPLSVGTHTVSFTVKAGYNGDNAVITFNGQTVQSGGSITITADMDSFTLTVTGAVPADYSGGSSGSSDDGMGLTDYLLIILVVLIVIMAIMVAMRLMRS